MLNFEGFELVWFSLFKIQDNRQICTDTCQILAQVGSFPPFAQGFVGSAFDVVKMGVNVIERVVGFQQVNGGLIANATYTRNVIGYITN